VSATTVLSFLRARSWLTGRPSGIVAMGTFCFEKAFERLPRGRTGPGQGRFAITCARFMPTCKTNLYAWFYAMFRSLCLAWQAR
jgi:hypothetical protein